VIRTIFLLLLLGLSAQAATFDASKNFSPKKNPNKGWQYGYSETHSLEPGDFRLDKSTGSLGKIGFWHPSVSDHPGPGYYPYVSHNQASTIQLGSSNGWSARAGQITMEASNTGQYSIVRFVTPKTGKYRVTANFEGVHFGLSTTDVHVLHNETSLFEAEIDGYGGDPAVHKVEGASPKADFSGEVELKKGDTVTFAVGYGKNHTNYGDTTGLFATLVLLGKSVH
jgi:hypothetical protein